MVLITTLHSATESLEPTIRNSNLFPVKANGEVRLRSVASFAKSGRVLTPVCNVPPFKLWVAAPVLISCVQHILQLFTQEYGNNSRRCLIGSQTVVISDIGCGFTKKICMAVYSTSKYRSRSSGTEHSRAVSCPDPAD